MLAGECRASVEGSERTLGAGEHVTLPPNVPHSHWNPSGRPNRILLEHRPVLETGPTIETLDRLAHAVEAGDDGRPNFLQFAVLQATHSDHASDDAPGQRPEGALPGSPARRAARRLPRRLLPR